MTDQNTTKEASTVSKSELSDLLACPFCGCTHIEIILEYHPRCSKCGATQEKILGKNAIKACNNRETKKQPTLEHQEPGVFFRCTQWSIVS